MTVSPTGIELLGQVQDVEKKLDHTRDPPRRHIVITSYDLAQKLQGYERHFGMIICDESHALKTRTSNRTQFFRTLLARNIAKRVLFLTGTPALSRPIELYTQVRPTCPTLHCIAAVSQGQWQPRCKEAHLSQWSMQCCRS